jgi:DNA-binding response OmpR family regulator
MYPHTPSPTGPFEHNAAHAAAALRPIMLIDDSRAVRVVIEASFRRAGMPVMVYTDGISAITALTTGEATVPEVLLLDIGLPKMDGYEVARILRTNAAFKNTTIIMLTGRGGVIDRVRSRMVGARDFIEKPFRVSHVVNVVRGYLGLPTSHTVEPRELRPPL